MDDVILRDVVTNLAILPAGGTPAQPHELLASGRFRQMVRETMREYDLTLYDTSPANQSPDAIAVANAAGYATIVGRRDHRSEEHTSELQSLMRISYAVFCLKKKKTTVIHIKKQI